MVEILFFSAKNSDFRPKRQTKLWPIGKFIWPGTLFFREISCFAEKIFLPFLKIKWLCGSRKFDFVGFFVDLRPMTSDAVSSPIDRFC